MKTFAEAAAGILFVCALLVAICAVRCDRWCRRHPERAEEISRIHAEAELVEEFDRVTSTREIPAGPGDGPLGLIPGRSIWVVECGACSAWWPPYADRAAAETARVRHVVEHARRVQAADRG